MNYIAYCVLYGLAWLSLVAAGTWLVITEHYGWAWIPWAVLFLIRFKPPEHSPQLSGKSK